MEHKTKRGSWGSTFGFLMAAIGSAVGLGNIWAFPYKMGANGGFPFLLIYLIVLVFVGFVVMLAEMGLGQKSGTGPVGTYQMLSKKYRWAGWFGVLAPFIILTFYSVLGAYCVKYMIANIGDLFGASFGTAGASGAQVFEELMRNQPESVLYTVLFMALTCVIVMGGIAKGIERFSKVAMPALAVMMVAIIVRSVTLPGAMEGLRFMFAFNLEPLREDFFSVLSTAGSQVFFSLSLGMGIMMTYGSYLDKSQNLEKNTLVIIIFDTLIALMSGVAVLPAAFALGGEGAAMAGPSLLFVTMQNVFESMGTFGPLFGAMFYLLVAIAAITSSISLVEVITTFFVDRARVRGKKGNRQLACVLSCVVITLLAAVVAADGLGTNGLWIPGRRFFGAGAWNESWLAFMDAWSEGVMMPLGALFLCVFLAYEYGIDRFSQDLTQNGHRFVTRGFFGFCMRVIAPLAMFLVLYGQLQSFFGNQMLSLGVLAAVVYLLLCMIPVGIVQNKGYDDRYQGIGFFLFAALTAVIPALVVSMCLNNRKAAQ
jgi:NSS family neurotransmitter:Na+ symporter